jgi:hypothetical protein
MRKVPAVAYVTRYVCPEKRVTFGLLPDFYASRMPGTLDRIEEVAVQAETARSQQKAADQARPADAPGAVTLGAALVWLRLRVIIARATLSTVIGLMPERFAGLPRGAPVDVWLGGKKIEQARVVDIHANCFVKRHHDAPEGVRLRDLDHAGPERA